MSTPYLSIVIPSFNQGDYIEETILSIVNQQRNDVEIIVLDGGSTDNSVDIIKKYQQFLSYWQSCKDNGQSDAINQGFRLSKGEYVTWLNSDDILLPNTLDKIIPFLKSNKTYNFFLGNVLWMDKTGTIIRANKVEKENKYWNKQFLFSNGGPSAFMRKSTLEQIGNLREDFSYMMDTELWYRFVATGNLFKRIPFYVWGLRLHENAKMSGHNFKDSPLSNPDHPSWIKKRAEHDFLSANYPINTAKAKVWRYLKFLGHPGISRILDRRLIGRNYNHFKVLN